MNSLYEIATDYRSVLNEISIEDELSTFDQIKKLSEIENSIDIKAVNIASFIKNLESEAETVRLAIKEMQDRVGRLDRKADYLSNYLKNNLECCGITEIRKSPHFIIKVKSNPPSVVIDNEELISPEYKKTKQVVTIDKTAIKNDISQGVIVEGARLEQKTRLEIK